MGTRLQLARLGGTLERRRSRNGSTYAIDHEPAWAFDHPNLALTCKTKCKYARAPATKPRAAESPASATPHRTGSDTPDTTAGRERGAETPQQAR